MKVTNLEAPAFVAKKGSAQQPIQKVLIANRGEIALRISKTLQAMGKTVVALCSDIDITAPHVITADEVIHLPGNTSAETYLQTEKILSEAKARGVDAIHPGYGFLSENADFARACAEADIVFIGPSPEAIDAMGDKIQAKTLMQAAGVPVVPGWSGDSNTPVDVLSKEADKIGYPILVKAAAGGGGKGMRLVHQASDLPGALEAAAREAQKAFGDARVFLEKYIVRPRHVEFQIFGDTHGNAVHLFERECSIQRRHQKIIEESPSPCLTPELRTKMGDAAVKAAKAIGYTNAGTVEFIVGQDGGFYFLEVNTRLQVEHPVTEMVTHMDLVRLQLWIAEGRPLPFTQSDLQQDGHAMECRLYAEDPQNQFLPSTGKITVYRAPEGPNIRMDSGVREGTEVSIFYDPMLAKLITWGKTRSECLSTMQWALQNTVILGINHNANFLQQILHHPQFIIGNIHTHFLDEETLAPLQAMQNPEAIALAAGMASLQQAGCQSTQARSASSADQFNELNNPWLQGGGWRVLADVSGHSQERSS